MWALVGALLRGAIAKMTANKALTALGLESAIEAGITLQHLRDQATVLAGNSDPNAIEEAARTAARMLGLDGSKVIIGKDRFGQPSAHYFHVDTVKGHAWTTAQYISPSRQRRQQRRFAGFRRAANNFRNQHMVMK